MEVVQVDVIRSETLQGNVDSFLDVLRRAVELDSIVRSIDEPALRGEKHLVALPGALEPKQRGESMLFFGFNKASNKPPAQ